MAHHKRGKPKSARAGCLLCKPHKDQRRAKQPRSMRARAILAESVAALVAAACTFTPTPTVPPVDPPPSDGGAAPSCATAGVRLRELGGCGIDLSHFEADCADANAAEAKLDLAIPVGCLTDAVDCAAARSCQ